MATSAWTRDVTELSWQPSCLSVMCCQMRQQTPGLNRLQESQFQQIRQSPQSGEHQGQIQSWTLLEVSFRYLLPEDRAQGTSACTPACYGTGRCTLSPSPPPYYSGSRKRPLWTESHMVHWPFHPGTGSSSWCPHWAGSDLRKQETRQQHVFITYGMFTSRVYFFGFSPRKTRWLTLFLIRIIRVLCN